MTRRGPDGARSRRGTLVVASVACLLAVGCGPTRSEVDPQKQVLVVFAASSLADAAHALADTFRVVNPNVSPQIALASSSVLARQIERGAPADVFLSANRDWILYLDSLSLLSQTRRLPITNRLVLYSRPNSLPDEGRIAVGDPDHVPVGRYARQLLTCTGEWAVTSPRIIPTGDARSAITLLRSDAVDHALSYYSDHLFLGSSVEVIEQPMECMPDIAYYAAVVARAGLSSAATAFVSFLASSEAGAVWQSSGFEPVVQADATSVGMEASE